MSNWRLCVFASFASLGCRSFSEGKLCVNNSERASGTTPTAATATETSTRFRYLMLAGTHPLHNHQAFQASQLCRRPCNLFMSKSVFGFTEVTDNTIRNSN
jgi:hypothetical protein